MADIYAGIDIDDLVTGEAVTLELPPASFGVRMLSGLIDVTIEGVLLIVGFLAVGFLATDEALYAVGSIVAFVGALVAYPTAIETWTRGKSVGKLAVGTRTVRDDAGPISFRHALLRSLLGVVEIWSCSGLPALITALVNGRGKRVGDLVAGTYVVRDKVGLTLPPVVPMPPQLARWAASADLAPLPEGLAVAIRVLLARLSTLSPDARRTLVTGLADQAMSYVAPPPPRGTRPEEFLAAVQAERRERDRRRLHRESEQRRRLTERRPAG